MRRFERWLLPLADGLIVLGTIYLAIFLRFQGEMAIPAKWFDLKRSLFYLAVVVASVLAFGVAGLYRRREWRYPTDGEIVAAVLKAMVPCWLLFLVIAEVRGGAIFSRSILTIAAPFVFVFVCGLRFMFRALARPAVDSAAPHVLLVGPLDAAESVQQAMTRSTRYIVDGFVSDDAGKRGTLVHGLPVHFLDELARLSADQVVVVEARPDLIRRVIEVCGPRKIPVRTIPAVHEVMEGRIQVGGRNVRIEDLLEREPVQLDLDNVRAIIEGKDVLITGAGGSIGSEIARQVARFRPRSLVLLGRGENSIYEISLELAAHQPVSVIADVRDLVRLRHIFEQHRPQVVFHAAAHKHVPLMEANVAEAVAVNVLGTSNVVQVAEAVGAERLILLSTDKAVKPTSVMGATKRMAELLLASSATTRCAAVRFGNVLDSRGSVIPTFRRQIAAGGPVTITDPAMTRFFMTIPEAVQLVLQAASIASSGDIYILDMGKPVRILDLARNMIRLSGFEPEKDVPIVTLGMRPGEKLTEELLNPDETSEPTDVPKVLHVRGNTRIPADQLAACLDQLAAAVTQDDQQVMRGLLRQYVPLVDSLAGRGGD
ncbi:MAG: polysaccharide biosynthesis protein [Candidatus Xenobia bacterium]